MISTTAIQLRKTISTKAARSLFTKSASALPQVSLDEEFPSIPATQPTAPKQPQGVVSKTASGLRIGSHNGDAYVATLGIEIAAGSRVENDDNAGVSHLFSKMAFRSTESRSDLRLYRDIEAIGGFVNTSAGRDFVRYSISVLPHQIEKAAEILAETTLAPRLANWDISTQKQKVEIDVEDLNNSPCSQVLEGVHAAAFYDDVTLGRPVFTTENLKYLDSEALNQFYEQYVNTSGLVLVGNGVEHGQLTDIANEYFAFLPTGTAAAKPPAKYVGGESRVKTGSVETYVALGFKGCAKNSAELPAARVLKALLASHLDSKKSGAFLNAYEDAGIFGLSGAASSSEAGALVDTFVAAMKKAASSAPSTEELANAKVIAAREAVDDVVSRQGRLNYFANLATTQTQAACVVNPIEAVTAKAVQELAQKALAARPSLSSVGILSSVPRLDAVISKLK